MMPSEAFLKLFEALYGALIDAISVGLELPSDLEFQGEVNQVSVPVRRCMCIIHLVVALGCSAGFYSHILSYIVIDQSIQPTSLYLYKSLLKGACSSVCWMVGPPAHR